MAPLEEVVPGGREKGREVGEGGEGGEESCHLSGSLPEVGRA